MVRRHFHQGRPQDGAECSGNLGLGFVVDIHLDFDMKREKSPHFW